MLSTAVLFLTNVEKIEGIEPPEVFYNAYLMKLLQEEETNSVQAMVSNELSPVLRHDVHCAFIDTRETQAYKTLENRPSLVKFPT